MNWRNVGILALIVVVLGGYVYFSNNRETEPEAIPVPTSLPSDLQPLALFPPSLVDDLARFEIRPSGGVTDTVFIRNDTGDWEQTVPRAAALVTTTVNTQLNTFLAISSRRTLAPDANPLEAYGLAEPSVEIIIVVNGDAGAVRRSLLIGNLVAGDGAYYVQVSGDPRVYIVNATSISPILGLANSPPIAPTATPEPPPTVEGEIEEDSTAEP